MAAPDRTPDQRPTEEQTQPDEESDPAISAYSTSEDRVVFTESDNGDGWISTDVTVDVEQ